MAVLGFFVDKLGTLVVGTIAGTLSSGIYEVGRTYLDYYVLDRDNGVNLEKSENVVENEENENEEE